MHPKTLIAALALTLPAFALVPRLHGQDVTVTPLEWAEPGDTPEQLPVENHPLRVEFPADLRNAPDPGYVVLQCVYDEKGRSLMLSLTGTLPAFETAVDSACANWKHKPARRLEHPVNAFVRCAVIFNPASAQEGKPDATARLLAVNLVVDPTRDTGKNNPPVPPELVWVTVILDSGGKPAGFKDAPPALANLLERAVREWRFAPARHAGQPVAAELRVPFIIVGPKDKIAGKLRLPRVIAQPAPVYPEVMRESGLRGEVLVDFIVDREGRVTRAYVVRSLNPAFDEPALEAVRRWRFEPGRKGDVPVNTHMRVPIAFRLDGEWEGGDSGLNVQQHAKQADLPEEFRYDVAPKPRGMVLPVYPYELLRENVKGDATVSFVISETGKIIRSGLVKASRPEFGAATLAMIEQWEFEPALKAGRPTRSRFGFEQEFSLSDGGIVPEKVKDLLTLERKSPDRIVSAGKLDMRLKPVVMIPPVFPRSLGAEIAKGEAMVEVLIDEEGQPRLPRIVSASDPAFGWAALQAVARWRFDPPTLKGLPVVTRVRIPFDFQIKADEAVEKKK